MFKKKECRENILDLPKDQLKFKYLQLEQR